MSETQPGNSKEARIDFPFEDDVAIAQAGGVVPLLILLLNGTNRQKAGAASALCELVDHPDTRQRIVKSKGVESLLELLDTGAELSARRTLQRIASYPDGQEAISKADVTSRDILRGYSQPHPGNDYFNALISEKGREQSAQQRTRDLSDQIYDSLEQDYRRFLMRDQHAEVNQNLVRGPGGEELLWVKRPKNECVADISSALSMEAFSFLLSQAVLEFPLEEALLLDEELS